MHKGITPPFHSIVYIGTSGKKELKDVGRLWNHRVWLPDTAEPDAHN
jgi:hypothetical protein